MMLPFTRLIRNCLLRGIADLVHRWPLINRVPLNSLGAIGFPCAPHRHDAREASTAGGMQMRKSSSISTHFSAHRGHA